MTPALNVYFAALASVSAVAQRYRTLYTLLSRRVLCNDIDYAEFARRANRLNERFAREYARL